MRTRAAVALGPGQPLEVVEVESAPAGAHQRGVRAHEGGREHQEHGVLRLVAVLAGLATADLALADDGFRVRLGSVAGSLAFEHHSIGPVDRREAADGSVEVEVRLLGDGAEAFERFRVLTDAIPVWFVLCHAEVPGLVMPGAGQEPATFLIEGLRGEEAITVAAVLKGEMACAAPVS